VLRIMKVTLDPLSRLSMILEIAILSSTNPFSATHCTCRMVLSIFHDRVSLVSRRSKTNGGDGPKK
jgi:hypothetical protein